MTDMMSAGTRPNVVFVVPWMRHYNAAFLHLLKERLDDSGVDMDVVYGQPTGVNAGRGDTVTPDWAIAVDHKEVGWGPLTFLWQPYVRVIRKADLVVAQQASKLLLNYLMLARQVVGGPRVAFWGHGRNFQAGESGIQKAAEQAKRLFTRQSHWFFAYTELSSHVLVENGYPADRITVVENSVDTRSLSAARDRVTDQDIRGLRAQIGIEGSHVGIFCGAMYPDKRLDFLLDAAARVRSRIPDFELVCVGGGVDRRLVEAAAQRHHWIHAVGPKFGDDLARHFAVASVYLLPFLVGLTVLDSFVFQTPIVTTAAAGHGPEIEYLIDGVNGLVVDDVNVDAYAEAVANLLSDEPRRQSLIDGCVVGAEEHSMEEMADRFASGLLLALSSD